MIRLLRHPLVLLRHPLVLLLLRLVVGAVFILASTDKILHPAAFSRSVYAYQILPLPVVNLFAIALPWSEMVAGVLLILGAWPRAAASLLSGMTAMFLVAILLVIARGIRIDCGCFEASGGQTVGWGLWLRDLLLLAGAVWTALWEDGARTGLGRWLPVIRS